MPDDIPEKRKFKRYNTDVKIYFEFAYDLETKVKFEFLNDDKKKKAPKKYTAVSRNISAQGLCFVSHKKVQMNDLLHLEVYLPSAKKPIAMNGQAKWCKPSPSSFDYGLEEGKSRSIFEVGVELLSVHGDLVPESIYFDKEYGVEWSIVLESVFGSYKTLMRKNIKRKTKKKHS